MMQPGPPQQTSNLPATPLCQVHNQRHYTPHITCQAHTSPSKHRWHTQSYSRDCSEMNSALIPQKQGKGSLSTSHNGSCCCQYTHQRQAANGQYALCTTPLSLATGPAAVLPKLIRRNRAHTVVASSSNKYSITAGPSCTLYHPL